MEKFIKENNNMKFNNFLNEQESYTLVCSNKLNREVKRDGKEYVSLKRAFMENPQTIPAIIVDKKTRIVLDGQNRLRTFQDVCRVYPNTMIKVDWVDVPETNMEQYILDINMNQRKWSQTDFYEKQIRNENKHIIMFDNFCRESELTSKNGKSIPRYGIVFLNEKASSLKTGVFETNNISQSIEDARILRSEVEKFGKMLGLSERGTWVIGCASVWKKLKRKVEFKKIYSEVSKHKKSYANGVGLLTSNQTPWKNIFNRALANCL